MTAGILALEPAALLVIAFALWYPSPIRDRWLWLLALLLPVMAARGLLHRRLWTRTPADGWFLAFLALGVANVYVAHLDAANPPYTRGLLMLGRPLQGMALYVYCVEYARTRGKTDALLAATTVGALLLGFLSLFSTQWVSKSDQLDFITRYLPTVDFLPGAATTFNPNEIAGGLAWLCPLMAGLAVRRWQARAGGETRTQRTLRWGTTAAFCLTFAGLFLGQSRLALLGVLAALVGIISLLVPPGGGRYRALGGVALLALLETALVFNLFPAAATSAGASAGLSGRDESSLSKRLGIWGSGLAIIRDYPLTGAGMAMYRDNRIRRLYPAPGVPNPPHAHNEWIQIGADLGLPGLAVYVAWWAAAVYMLAYSWRRGDVDARAAVIAIGGGLLAHAVFGLGDAIPLWDRLSFVYWWLLGLVGAHYVLARGLACGQRPQK